MVIDHTGKAVPGFPSVVLLLPFDKCPPLSHPSGVELHQGWSAPEDIVAKQDANQYLKLFNSSGPSDKVNPKYVAS